jgi:hypothetical protein
MVVLSFVKNRDEFIHGKLEKRHDMFMFLKTVGKRKLNH